MAMAATAALLIVACAPAAPARENAEARLFPAPDRPVASIVTDESGPESQRDRVNEARIVMDLLKIAPGARVADIGAGAGYFTVRLSERVGPTGQVIAQDIVPAYQERLKARVAKAALTNVSFVLGGPDDARLAPGSVDVALMVRMYHEIEEPYAFMWRLRESLREGGVVAISERDRATQSHGTPPALLRCELEAVGYVQKARHSLGESGYLAVFAPEGARPEPGAIKACKA
jgi:predicted methyltransferase